jgi:cytidylate kinase
MSLELAPKLIGIAGTNGSGKDTIGNILANDYGYMFISLTDSLRVELKKQGLSLARENMRNLSSEWRRLYGLSALVDKARECFSESNGNYFGLAMASIRNPGEADAIHQAGGIVIWVDADPQIRYKRISENSLQRGKDRMINDNVTFTEFIAEEAVEMNHPKNSDGTTLSGFEVKAKSDIFIDNDGLDFTELNVLVGHQLNLIR